MTEPTLIQIFGTDATQDANTVTIQKSALATVGLTASANNKAESILAAILLLARINLNQSNFDTDIDYSIVIESGFSSFIARGTNNTPYRVDQLTVNLAKPDSSSILDPNDY
jgi:hypothetical protein